MLDKLCQEDRVSFWNSDCRKSKLHSKGRGSRTCIVRIYWHWSCNLLMCFRCRRCSLPGERLSRRRHHQSVDCDRSNLSAHCRIDQQRPVASLSARLQRQLQPDIALQGSHAECQMHCPFTRAYFINYLCYVLYDLLAFTHL